MSGTTSSITRIGTVLLPVGDQEAARTFFVDTLDFEVLIDGDMGGGQRWLEVAPKGAETSIALVPRGMAAGVEISFATDDAESAHALLIADGDLDVDPELTVMGEGVPPMFTFRDLDGNPFRVVERD